MRWLTHGDATSGHRSLAPVRRNGGRAQIRAEPGPAHPVCCEAKG